MTIKIHSGYASSGEFLYTYISDVDTIRMVERFTVTPSTEDSPPTQVHLTYTGYSSRIAGVIRALDEIHIFMPRLAAYASVHRNLFYSLGSDHEEIDQWPMNDNRGEPSMKVTHPSSAILIDYKQNGEWNRFVAELVYLINDQGRTVDRIGTP